MAPKAMQWRPSVTLRTPLKRKILAANKRKRAKTVRVEGKNLTTPLVYQTGPKTSAKSGCSCSMREKRSISGRSLASGIMGIKS